VVIQNSWNRRRNEEKCPAVMEDVAYDTAVHMKVGNPQKGRKNKLDACCLIIHAKKKKSVENFLSCHRKKQNISNIPE
jgi:hypothetical protein